MTTPFPSTTDGVRRQAHTSGTTGMGPHEATQIQSGGTTSRTSGESRGHASFRRRSQMLPAERRGLVVEPTSTPLPRPPSSASVNP